MALSRSKNNIVNLQFGIMNEDQKQGVDVSQAIINGRCAAVSLRAINGGRKSAAVKLEGGVKAPPNLLAFNDFSVESVSV